jgi:hypothetical protein
MDTMLLLNRIAVWGGAGLCALSLLLGIYNLVLALMAIKFERADKRFDGAIRHFFDAVLYGAGSIALKMVYDVLH